MTESQAPLLVKTGVRSWKARRVPVGSRFAKLAVLVRVWDSARRDSDCDEGGGVSPMPGDEVASLDVDGLCLTDIVLNFPNSPKNDK